MASGAVDLGHNTYLAMLLFMWSNHNRIRPHAKYRRREQPESRSEKKKTGFDHFVRSQAAGGAQDGQYRTIRCWHVVGSCHDPTTCKVSAPRTAFHLTLYIAYSVGHAIFMI
jgi:hypothetical protein